MAIRRPTPHTFQAFNMRVIDSVRNGEVVHVMLPTPLDKTISAYTPAAALQLAKEEYPLLGSRIAIGNDPIDA